MWLEECGASHHPPSGRLPLPISPCSLSPINSRSNLYASSRSSHSNTPGVFKNTVNKKIGSGLATHSCAIARYMGTGVFVTVTVPADKVEEFLKVRTVAGWSALALAFQSRWF